MNLLDKKLTEEKSTDYLCFLRIISSLAVIMIHVLCTPVSICENAYTEFGLLSVKYFRNVLTWCVPVFVMITGSLFLNPSKEVSFRKILFKYVRRIILVILTFGTLFCLMELVFSEKQISSEIIFKSFLNSMTGHSWDHMWYLYMLAGLYIFIPALKVFVNSVPEKILIKTLVVLFVVSSVVPFLGAFIDIQNEMPAVSIYIFYLLLGYAVHFNKIKLNNGFCLIFVCVYLLYVFLINQSSFFYIKNNAALKTLGYDSPFTILAALGIFSLAKNNLKEASDFVKFLAPLTFCVYIVHAVPVNFCYKVLHITVEQYSLAASLLIVSIVTILISFALAWILRLIPFVRKYFL